MRDYVSKLDLYGKITAKHAEEINEIIDGLVKKAVTRGFNTALEMIAEELKDWDNFSFKGENTTLNRIIKMATDQTKEVK